MLSAFSVCSSQPAGTQRLHDRPLQENVANPAPVQRRIRIMANETLVATEGLRRFLRDCTSVWLHPNPPERRRVHRGDDGSGHAPAWTDSETPVRRHQKAPAAESMQE